MQRLTSSHEQQSLGRDKSTIDDALSRLVTRSRSSVIRDLLRQASRPDVLSLAGGLPSASCLPSGRIAQAAASVLSLDRLESETAAHPLQYGLTQGDPTLISALEHRGWIDPGADVLITTGSQQALDLLGASLIDPGDVIVVPVPSYLGAIQAFEAYQPRLVGVGADEEGLDTNELSQLLSNGLRPKFVYVVSQFANPDGVTLSDSRRDELAALAEQYGFLIVDDDPYGELRFAGAAPTPLIQRSSRVIALGSVSKVLAPGLRVGWAQGPHQIVDAMTKIKQARDLHTGSLSQAIAADVLGDEPFMDEHLRHIKGTYRAGAAALDDALRNRAASVENAELRWRAPEGGMFIWLTWCGIDTDRLLPIALDVGVAFVPGSAFGIGLGGGLGDDDQAHQQLKQSMRLSYATLSSDGLNEACDRLFTASRILR